VEDPFFVAFISKLRPSYQVPGRFMLVAEIFVAEHARVFELECARLHAGTKWIALIDGWADPAHRDLYGTVAQERGVSGILLSLEDVTGKRVTGEDVRDTLYRGAAAMGVTMRSFLAICSDSPKVMLKFRRLTVNESAWMLVSVRSEMMIICL
jgi:hypothetical protein